LIIELDGGQHADNPHDAIRDKWLIEQGYRVVRFWNNDIIKNIEGVLEEIARALQGESPPYPDR
jgi:very-short-patch-repair endonuclease